MTTIEVVGLVKKFGSHTALNGISFSVPQNVRCIGFLGPNGSGKTTSIRIMAGLLKPTAGTVTVAGVDVIENPEQIRSIIGYVEQHPALLNWMTGYEFLVFVGRIFKLPPAECRDLATHLLKRVGLEAAAKRRIGGYSGGMKKRLGIAQGLMGRPQVLFLDEPVAEMDPIGRMEILQLIEELKGEVTLFMSTHILEDVERVADQIIIMTQGELRSISTMEQLRARYETSTLCVEVASRQSELYRDLETGKPGLMVESVRMQGERLLITPIERQQFEPEFQSYLYEHQYGLRHYEWVVPTLEEIFVKVVGES